MTLVFFCLSLGKGIMELLTLNKPFIIKEDKSLAVSSDTLELI